MESHLVEREQERAVEGFAPVPSGGDRPERDRPQRVRFDLVNVALATAVVILVVQAFTFIDLIRHVLLLLILALLLATGIKPLVERSMRSGVGLAPTVLGIYLVIIGVVGILGFAAGQVIANQAAALTSDLPNLSQRLSALAAGLPGPLRDLGTSAVARLRPEEIGPMLSSVLSPDTLSQVLLVTVTVFDTVFSVFTVFVIAYFWIAERQVIRRLVLRSFHPEHRPKVQEIWADVEERLGAWLRGQLLLMLIIGAAQGIGYAIFGLPFALLLAVFAGLAEAIPMVGPTLGAIPAILIALTVSPQTALLVVAYTVLVHVLEGNVLVPRIMEHAVGLTPLTVILALLVGSAIGGIIGALLAIPIAAAVQAAIVDLVRESRASAPATDDVEQSDKRAA